MRKTFLPFICFSLLLITAISCSDELFHSLDNPQGKPIMLSGKIMQEYATRANDYGFVAGDRMGIYVVDRVNGEAGVLGADDNRGQNILYTLDENYQWKSPTTLYWRDQQTPIDIYGYYPGVNYISSPTAYSFAVQTDQSKEAANGDLSGYEQSDLLWGKATNVSFTSEQILVQYNHILAGVRVQLNKGTGISDTEWGKLEKLVLVENTVVEGTVDLSQGTVTKATKTASIRMAPQSDGGYRAVVIPQTLPAGKQLISITLDGQTYSHALTTDMQYQSGKLHNFTLTVNKSEATGDYETTLTATGITPWVNDESSHQFSSMQYVIVHCSEMGKLKESITAAGFDYKTIQNLKVMGVLTTEDFYLLRDEMPELKHLNLKDVKIKNAYMGWDMDWNDIHADNAIPYNAFINNKNIRSLILPSNLKRLAAGSLSGMQLMCSTLEIPDGVTYLGDNACSYNEDNDVELILPSSIDSIGANAFRGCGWKCELKLSDNIKYIGEGAFSGWQNERLYNFHGTFHIPSHLKELPSEGFCALGGNGSFNGEIEIPQGITEIPDKLFCNGVENMGRAFAKRLNLHIPDGVSRIGSYTFSGLRLSQLRFPNDLEEIGYEAFYGTSIPFSVSLPSNLKVLGTRAFWNAGMEGELVIPESCLKLEPGAFSLNNFTKVTLPKNLETIPAQIFCSNTQLTQITIPKYVGYIGNYAFSGCTAMQTIICLNPEPPSLGITPFTEGDGYSYWIDEGIQLDKCVLEVPENSIELYRHADGWKDFKNITAYHELAFNIPEIVCMDKGITRQGILRAEGEWEVSECPSWVTVSPSSGDYKEELTVTVKPGNESREGRIVFRLKDKDYTTYTTVRQVYSSEYPEDATVTLQTASAGGKAIPIFIVGEGYGTDDIVSGQYLADMREQMEHLFSIEPYKSYRNYFTVSTAYACSPESGMSGQLRFQPKNPWENSNDEVWKYASQHGAAINNNATILVLCNTSAYDNHTDLWDNGTSFSWIGKNGDIYPYDQRGDVLHYVGGRGFGKLGPEYVNHFTFIKACTCPGCNMTHEYDQMREKGWWQNVSISAKMTELPWYPFIFHDNYSQLVDVYEGALNHARGTYRSENQSVMGAAHIYYYNTISRYEIVKRIMQAAGKPFSLQQFIDNDKIEIPE